MKVSSVRSANNAKSDRGGGGKLLLEVSVSGFRKVVAKTDISRLYAAE